MRILALSPMDRLAEFAPLVVRAIVGVIMAAHGLQKFLGGPANFGGVLGQLGVPAPTLMAFVVTFVELGGGILLVVGLLSRLAALLLTFNLAVAILLVKIGIGFLSPQSGGVGAEFDLALIAGFLAVLFAGPGRISLDHALGIEGGVAREGRGTRGGRSQTR